MYELRCLRPWSSAVTATAHNRHAETEYDAQHCALLYSVNIW